MVALYLTLLLSPFAVGCAIAASSRAKSFIGRHYVGCITAGWTAVALTIPAAVALEGGRRVAALACLCPLMALSFWRRADGPDDDGGGGSDPDPTLPKPPEIDWDRFMRDLDEYAGAAR